MNRKKIIFCGGGTAGHITPNLALFPFLSNFELHYAGQKDSLEEKLVGAFPLVTFHQIECVKFIRGLNFKNALIPFKLCSAVNSAKTLLKELSPSLIFSKGGFVSLPLTLAASKKIPLVIHESDRSLGLANKLVKNKARFVCGSFSSAVEKLNNGIVTGSPIRSELYNGDRLKAEKECRLIDKKPRLLIMGGSQGSASINKVVFACLNELCEHFNVVHIVGKKETNAPRHSSYFPIAYCFNIADYFAWCDICVSRGGSNSIFELAALKKPTLIIPLEKGSRGDQLQNAKYFCERGFASCLLERDLTTLSLLENIAALYSNRYEITKNLATAPSFDGSRKIADLILRLLQ